MSDFFYSDKYEDDNYEYRHVHVPKHIASKFPNRLMTESEWRSFGVQQSPGWEHYMIHAPERHILLFRRLLPGKKAPQERQPVRRKAQVAGAQE